MKEAEAKEALEIIESMKEMGLALYITYSMRTRAGVSVGRLVLDNCRAPTTLTEIQWVEAFAFAKIDPKHGASNLFLTWWQELDMERA